MEKKKIKYIAIVALFIAVYIGIQFALANREQRKKEALTADAMSTSEEISTDEPQYIDMFEGVVLNADGIYPDITFTMSKANSPFSTFLPFAQRITYQGIDKTEITVNANVDAVSAFLEEHNFIPMGDEKTFVYAKEKGDTYLVSGDLLTASLKEQLVINMKTMLEGRINQYNLQNGDAPLNGSIGIVSKYIFIPAKDTDYMNSKSTGSDFYSFLVVFQNADGQAFVLSSHPVISADGTLNGATSYELVEHCEDYEYYMAFPDVDTAKRGLMDRHKRLADVCKNEVRLICEMVG